jgi:adenosylhomocysteine nucleosidase
MAQFAKPGWASCRSVGICLLLLLSAMQTNALARVRASLRPILVVTAVDNEFTALRSDLRNPRDGLLGGRQISVGYVSGARVVVIRTGWGKAHAAGATAEAIARFNPRIVIMAGTAGSLDPHSVVSGDVVITEAAFQYDLGRFDKQQLTVWPPENPVEQPYPNRHFLADQSELNKVIGALSDLQFSPWTVRNGCACARDGSLKPGCTGDPYRVDREHPRVCVGTTATGDSFDMGVAAAAQLSLRHAAVGVDMETAAVAEEAADHKLPFVGIRVITDVVGDTNGANLYFCLKPLSGERLAVVMKKVLSALASPSSGASSVQRTQCKSAAVAGNPSAPTRQ